MKNALFFRLAVLFEVHAEARNDRRRRNGQRRKGCFRCRRQVPRSRQLRPGSLPRRHAEGRKFFRSRLRGQLRCLVDSNLDIHLDSYLRSHLFSHLASNPDSHLGSPLDSYLGSDLGSHLGSHLVSHLV